MATRTRRPKPPPPAEEPKPTSRGFRPANDLTAEAATESARAKAALVKQGLHLPPRPEYDVPSLPEGLPDLDDTTLMDLFVKLTHWSNHLAGQLAEAEIDERTAEHVLDVAEASAMVLKWGDRKSREDTITLAKAQAKDDDKVQTAKDELHVVYARRKLLNVMFTSAEKDAAVVSRELTRRVGRNDREQREARWRP